MTGVDKYFAGRTSGGESRAVNKKTAPHVATNDAGACTIAKGPRHA